MDLFNEQLFPIPLSYDGIEDGDAWKLQLDFDRAAKKFTLAIDGIDFLTIHIKQGLTPTRHST